MLVGIDIADVACKYTMVGSNSPTWCGRLFGDYLMNWSTSRWRSCCKMPWSEIVSTGDSPWQADRIDERRRASMTGQRHPDCSACWDDEDREMPSFRQTAASSRIMNRFILNLGNTCNLACTYCYSGNSSIWANKTGNHPQIPSDIMDSRAIFWKWWDSVGKGQVQRLVISGGEPSLMSETYQWIERANLSGKEILFNTNAAVNESWWKRFLAMLQDLSAENRVIVRVSMDAVDQRFEWIRTGLKWNTFEKNLVDLASISLEKNIVLRISPTLSCLTLEGILDTAKWTKKLADSIGGGNRLVEYDAFSMVSEPINQRPDPWLGYFKEDLRRVNEMSSDVCFNHDLSMQLRSLIRLADKASPTLENARSLQLTMSLLENQWGKTPWADAFPRLHSAVMKTVLNG